MSKTRIFTFPGTAVLISSSGSRCCLSIVSRKLVSSRIWTEDLVFTPDCSEPDEPPAIPDPTTESHLRTSLRADWLLQRNVSKIFPCGNHDARCHCCSGVENERFVGLDFLNRHELFCSNGFLEKVYTQADFFQNWRKRSC